ETVSSAEASGVLGLKSARGFKGIERLESARRAQRWIIRPVYDLERLHKVFNVDQGPRAKLGVHCSRLNQLFHLKLAHAAVSGQSERLGTIDVVVTEDFPLPAELRIARDGTQLDQCLALISPCGTADAVIVKERCQGRGGRTAPAVGAKPEIELERAVVPRG